MAANRVGKSLVTTCPVYTYDGVKMIGELVVGDLVMGEDGLPHRVVGVYDQGMRPIYRLTFDDKVEAECDEEHLWKYVHPRNVHRRSNRKNGDYLSWRVGTTKEIMGIGGLEPDYKRRIRIPVCQPVQFARRENPLHPYLVGVLLGNGYLGDAQTSISEDHRDVEVIERVASVLPDGYTIRKCGGANYSHDIISPNRDRSYLVHAIRSMGLEGTRSGSKFIPEMYKYTCVADRLELLRGLMDCDGTIDDRYGRASYSTISERLAQDVKWLVQSLGGKSVVSRYDRTDSGRGVEYRVTVFLRDINPFHLKRKADRHREDRRNNGFRTLHKIEYVGCKPARCIEVEGEGKTYLINDFIVTHNTEGAAAETTYHLTGKYPAWWKGRRFRKPVLAWVCGATNEKTRDTVQKKLFGDPMLPDAWGTGFVPLNYLSDADEGRVRKPNVPNAWQSVMVRHHTDGIFDGWSVCTLKAYEAGYKIFTSESVDVIWLDEEPPQNIMTQAMIRQVDNEGILYMTFTPEEGVTLVVDQFMNRLAKGQFLINATWDDAPHLTPERRQQILDALPEHERDMRSKGIPVIGSGLVFPIADEDIMVEPFAIPRWYRHIAGIDIGAWNHNTAGAWLAYNADNDTVYVYDTYKAQGKTPPIHATRFRGNGEDILIVYPHDGEKGDRHTGESVAQLYRNLGCNMHTTHYTNPPPVGKEEGQGGISVDAGLIEMLTRMETGRFKVFKTCRDWFEEKRMYHRKDGKVVRVNEDIMSATRYAHQMLRFAMPRRGEHVITVLQSDIDFDPYTYDQN